MTFGQGQGTMASVSKTDEKSATEMIHRAMDAGINFFDSADAYASGQSETILGRALGARRRGMDIQCLPCSNGSLVVAAFGTGGDGGASGLRAGWSRGVPRAFCFPWLACWFGQWARSGRTAEDFGGRQVPAKQGALPLRRLTVRTPAKARGRANLSFWIVRETE